ncbi:carbohydrate ABC transporter permease [Rathayibacter soli]|uniref:carbohydrate ABC transporter permease n=1 Tax=Rathayibacter soli TaxID=3144168 RepID=UPI0027E4B295|nr:carbohydrate ABC transporter permease [Glaciibacter superstes]
MKTERRTRWIIAIPMALLGLATLYPMFFAANISMMSKLEFVINPLSLAKQFGLSNYIEAWLTSSIGTYLINSIVVTVSTVVLLAIIGSMAGYSFSQLKFRGSQTLFLLCLAAMMIPFQVIMVPFVKVLSEIGLLDTYPGLVLAYVGQFLPFTVYLMTSYYARIPREIIEAARIDGNTTWGVYRRIMIQLGKPALLSISILNALFCWNDILIALLVMRSPQHRTVMIGVASLLGQYPDNMPTYIAGVVIAALPMVLVYLVFQRQIAAGVVVGATKG